jgi:hypothetical protein
MESKQRNWLIGGGILALAVVVGVYMLSREKPIGETDKSACVIAAASIPFFAAAVKKGNAAAVASIGGIITGPVCLQLAEDLQQHPEEPSDTPIQAQTPSGQTTPPEPVTLSDLFAPAPAPEEAPVDFSRALACIQTYPSQNQALLRDFCYKGLLEPQRS